MYVSDIFLLENSNFIQVSHIQDGFNIFLSNGRALFSGQLTLFMFEILLFKKSQTKQVSRIHHLI